MLKKILLKRIRRTLLICIICIMLIFAGIVLILEGTNLVDSGESGSISNSISTAITDVDIKDLIQKSDSEVWELLTGTAYDKKPTLTQVPESLMSSRLTDITVPIRTSSGSSETTFTVNTALAKLFTAFFQDLYNECPDFYVVNFGGYVFKDVNNGTTGSMSAHAVGAAVDINAEQNPWLQKPYTKDEYEKLDSDLKHYVIYYDSPMVQIAKKYTLSWGGLWRDDRKDPMHFSFIGDWTRARTLQEYGS